MKPKGLVIAIASIFIVCVAASLAMGVARLGSLKITYLLIFGLAIGLAVDLVRGSHIGRWIAVVVAAYGAVGIYLNSTKSLAMGMIILGVAFSLCAIGLLTPFAGRHFAKKKPSEKDDASET